jgi:hypothetical protein
VPIHLAPQHVQAAAPMQQIWFGMSPVSTPEGRHNWDKVFLQPDAAWPEILDHVQVISATEQALNHLSDNELVQVIARLNQHNIKLSVAVLAQNWVNEPKCGFGVEGYSDPAGNARLVAKLLRAGARVSYLGMDEPLFFGHYYNGKNACHSSIGNIGDRVVVILREYLRVFPNASIIDTEPFPAISDRPGWRDDYKEWALAFRTATGRSIDGINIDINWPANWTGGVVAALELARSMQLSFGIIYWASPTVPVRSHVSNDLWLSSAG